MPHGSNRTKPWFEPCEQPGLFCSVETNQCLPAGGQAAVQPGSQAAPFQEHLGPFPEQADPLYWLLIKGLGRGDREGAPKGLAAGRGWR